ncbi:MAG: NADH-quinone oxidoreductase subunit A [Chloroflexi bacterium]|nr:NADH-quinone oxidoreductase subunit A [Chloroflexota bacterium]
MVASFGPVALAAVIATVFGLLPLAISALLAPRRPNVVKNSPYECGVETIGPTNVQFKSHFYLYALIFVIFDVEALFLFPWAVTYTQLGLYALIEVGIFIGLLLVGYAYAWRKGALEWV